MIRDEHFDEGFDENIFTSIPDEGDVPLPLPVLETSVPVLINAEVEVEPRVTAHQFAVGAMRQEHSGGFEAYCKMQGYHSGTRFTEAKWRTILADHQNREIK
jgi:hypothetical protein